MRNMVLINFILAIFFWQYTLIVQGLINNVLFMRLQLRRQSLREQKLEFCRRMNVVEATRELNNNIDSSNMPNDGRSGKYKYRKGMGKLLIKELDGILKHAKRQDDRKVAVRLTELLEKSDSVINRAHALSMMRLAAKYQFDITTAIPLSKVLNFFSWDRLQSTSHVNEMPIWEGYMISQLLYGLRMFNDKTEGIENYLEYLADAIEESDKQTGA
mgnify:CR=1 FL=1